MNHSFAVRFVSIACALVLAACGTEESTSTSQKANTSATQISANNANLELDLRCDNAAYPSAELLQCELTNVARTLEANIALYHQDGRLSCEMKRAKVTVSKTLNQAFLANKPQQQTIVQAAVQSTAEVSVK